MRNVPSWSRSHATPDVYVRSRFGSLNVPNNQVHLPLHLSATSLTDTVRIQYRALGSTGTHGDLQSRKWYRHPSQMLLSRQMARTLLPDILVKASGRGVTTCALDKIRKNSLRRNSQGAAGDRASIPVASVSGNSLAAGECSFIFELSGLALTRDARTGRLTCDCQSLKDCPLSDDSRALPTIRLRRCQVIAADGIAQYRIA